MSAEADLWSPLQGTVVPFVSPVFVMPQEPYIFTGSFEELVCYGVSKDRISSLTNARKGMIVELLNLDRIVARCDKNWNKSYNWPLELSRGEQQRVSLARVFFEMPELVLMDEATSAISERMEEMVYKQFARDQITVVTLGHHVSNIGHFHKKKLEIVRIGRSTSRLQAVSTDNKSAD